MTSSVYKEAWLAIFIAPPSSIAPLLLKNEFPFILRLVPVSEYIAPP